MRLSCSSFRTLYPLRTHLPTYHHAPSPLSYLFTTNNKPQWLMSLSNKIFKDYYSKRLTLRPQQLQPYLSKLSQTKFQDSDHRWLSLLSNIQTNINIYDNRQLLSMLRALVKIDYPNDLSDRIVGNLMEGVGQGQLNFQQLGLLLWCLSRVGFKEVQQINVIYNSMIHIFESYKQDNQIPIIIKSNEVDIDVEQLQNKVLVITVGNICRILTSMANLRLTQKKLLKYLIKNVIREHINAFNGQTLSNILLAYEKLGMRNKRDTLLVYQKIREKYVELQGANISTLFNLAICVSNLTLRDYSQHEEQRFQEVLESKEKHEEGVEDMKNFFLWIFQTIFLKDSKVSREMSAKLVFYSSKGDIYHEYLWKKAVTQIVTQIQDSKIIDLVMTLKALSLLNRDKRIIFEQQQKKISIRLWALYSSIEGKSLDILSYLYQKKRIHPPPKMSKVIIDNRLKQQSRKLSKESSPPKRHPQTQAQ